MLWRAVYGEPWPTGWKVKWIGWMRGAMGLCCYGEKCIKLNYGDFARPHYVEYWDARTIYVGGNGIELPPHCQTGNVIYTDGIKSGPEISAFTPRYRLQERSVIETLIHEFTHVRNRGLRHGKEFSRLVCWGLDRLGLQNLRHLA
jgi:hypothetical protein